MVTRRTAVLVPIEAAKGVFRWDGRCACGWKPKRAYGDRAVAQQVLDAHVARAHCPTPGKRGFGTKSAAAKSLGAIWRRGRGRVLPSRAYRCACGVWHLTSKAGQS